MLFYICKEISLCGFLEVRLTKSKDLASVILVGNFILAFLKYTLFRNEWYIFFCVIELFDNILFKSLLRTELCSTKVC